MPRANRHFLSEHVWHITHRCHKKEFLLKFARDRRRWVYWLFEAKKCYGVRVLNYTVTSNHIHLLVKGTTKRDAIPRVMQLSAGRTGQEYNRRKKRKGAYWEDRYHATAVATDHHLRQRLLYIDLNMVRAGVVAHPSEWPTCGYRELLNPRRRGGIMDHELLMELLHVSTIVELQRLYREWIDAALGGKLVKRESRWTESVAVGGESFVEAVHAKLGSRAKGRCVQHDTGSWVLQEPSVSSRVNFDPENVNLSTVNNLFLID